MREAGNWSSTLICGEIIALGEADVEWSLPNASAAFGLAYHWETYSTWHRWTVITKIPLTSECLRSQQFCSVVSLFFDLFRIFDSLHSSQIWTLPLTPAFKFPLFFLHLHLAQPWPLRQNRFTRGMRRRFASITNFFTRRKCLILSPWTQTIRRVRTSIRCTTKVGRIRMLTLLLYSIQNFLCLHFSFQVLRIIRWIQSRVLIPQRLLVTIFKI